MAEDMPIERLVYPGFWFGKTDPQDAVKLARQGVGGFCIYGGSAQEVLEFTSNLRREAGRELLFCADYEDGTGQWVKEGTLLPSNMAIGASASFAFAARKGKITAVEASAMGVDWVLAPVLDLASNPNNPIVNTRAFSSEADLVVEMAGAYLQGLKNGGCFSCLKHFPGHGATEKDSHLELPVINVSSSELGKRELKPYAKLVGKADAVMVGHILAKSLDANLMASASSKIMGRLLRWELRHRGRVVTDALLMGAVSDWRRTALLAVLSGADTLLAPQEPFELCDFLARAKNAGAIPAAVLESASDRQAAMLGAMDPARQRPDIAVVGCEEHRQAVAQMSADCMAWHKRPLEIPLRRDDVIHYEEPGADTPDDWQGKAFVGELKRLGLKVGPLAPDSNKLLLASFSRPRAFSGSINLDSRQVERLRGVAQKYKETAAVSFGSPFVFSGLGVELGAALCAFSHCQEFQRAAARIMAGYEEAGGTMPVHI